MKRLKTSIITSDSIHELNNIKGPIIESMISIDVIGKIYNKYKVLHHIGDKTNIVNEDYFKSISKEDGVIEAPVVPAVAVVEETPVIEEVVEDTVVVEEAPITEETVEEVIEDVAVVEETPVIEEVVEDTVVVNKNPKNDKKTFDKNKNKK